MVKPVPHQTTQETKPIDIAYSAMKSPHTITNQQNRKTSRTFFSKIKRLIRLTGPYSQQYPV